MTAKLLILAVLLLAVKFAGARTKTSSPGNKNASHPTTAPGAKSASAPHRNETASPPPIASGAKTTPSAPNNGTVSPPPPAAIGGPTKCLDDLVEFSKCLPYISSSPNNATASPSRQCCNDVASAFRSGTSLCYCYLVQKPGLLGFPLNSTRILSLSSLCPIRDHGTKSNFSLTSICSGIGTLPPLTSITVPERPKPHISGPPPPVQQISGSVNPSPTSRANLSQDSTADSGTPGQADSHSHPAPTIEVFPEWRTFSINKSAVIPAGFSLSWWLFLMLLPMVS